MAPHNRFQRPYQPEESEVNVGFLQAYLSRTDASVGADGRVADKDASFTRLLRWLGDLYIPTVPMTDAAIRVGLPSHSALPALVIRQLVQFTLLYALCILLHLYNPARTFEISVWCISANLTIASILQLARHDPTLFFEELSQCLRLLAGIALALPLFRHTAPETLIWFVAGIVLAFVVAFPRDPASEGGTGRALRLSFVLVLLYVLPQPSSIDGSDLLVAAYHFLANCGFLLPLPFAMQHWFAAHRYASLDDVRIYGSGASGPRANLLTLFSGLWATATALAAGIGCALAFAAYVSVLVKIESPSEHFQMLLYCLLTITLIAAANWSLFALVVRRGLPKPSGFLASYYATWRALAVWLGHKAPLIHPTVFEFQRPWSNRTLRTGLVSLALALNAALVLTPIVDWTRAHLPPEPPVEAEPAEDIYEIYPGFMEAPRMIEEVTSPPVSAPPQWTPLKSPGYWMAVIALAAFLPTVIFFTTLHAAWGPTFQAYSDRFECFDDSVTPPVLNVVRLILRGRFP